MKTNLSLFEEAASENEARAKAKLTAKAKPSEKKMEKRSEKSKHETSMDILDETIVRALQELRTPNDFKDFVSSLYKDILVVKQNDPIWKLLNHLETDTDFYLAPASTHYHGSYECGLIHHSLLVAARCAALSRVMLPSAMENKDETYALLTASLFHDLCKTNMYETRSRNVKNDKTGKWESVPCYMVRGDYLAVGHGAESLAHLNQFITLPVGWQHAIRWHMGAYDACEGDRRLLGSATKKHREVLLLHTADMLAGIVEGV
jgi:hypothetical protein